MKTEYLNEVRELIKSHYTPVESLLDESEYTVKKSLAEIHRDITNILPAEWVYKSDLYEILKELGFKSFLVTVDVITIDDEGVPTVKEESMFAYLLDKKTAAV